MMVLLCVGALTVHSGPQPKVKVSVEARMGNKVTIIIMYTLCSSMIYQFFECCCENNHC